MQTRILVALLCGCATTAGALAETIVVDDQVQVRQSPVERPKRGITMAQVEARFGAPVTRTRRSVLPELSSLPKQQRLIVLSLGGALLAWLAVWAIRRWRGNGAIQPAKPAN